MLSLALQLGTHGAHQHDPPCVDAAMRTARAAGSSRARARPSSACSWLPPTPSHWRRNRLHVARPGAGRVRSIIHIHPFRQMSADPWQWARGAQASLRRSAMGELRTRAAVPCLRTWLQRNSRGGAPCLRACHPPSCTCAEGLCGAGGTRLPARHPVSFGDTHAGGRDERGRAGAPAGGA